MNNREEVRFRIVCNPYLRENKFFMNGKDITDKSFSAIKRDRLQTWFYKKNNWGGLADKLDELANGDLPVIEFCGREIDFNDLKDYLNSQQKKFYFDEEKLQFTQSDNEIENKLRKVVSQFKSSPIPELRKRANEFKEKFEAAIDSQYDMVVVAPMSSGKSTLINALIGQELMPVANQSTTAKIVEIIDVDDAKGFIVSAFDKDDKMIADKQEASLQMMQSLNKNADVDRIQLEGNIPGISNKSMRLTLVDTPGPRDENREDDENGQEAVAHEEIMKAAIQDKDNPLILYIMDMEKLRDKAEATTLRLISETISEATDLQGRDRFIFVINRADAHNEAHDGSWDDVLTNQRDYLKKKGIDASQIIPISALLAFAVRMKQSNMKLDRKTEAMFEYLRQTMKDENITSHTNFTPSCHRELEKLREEAQNDEYLSTLIDSGIIGLELVINEYLQKYAKADKLADAIQSFKMAADYEGMLVQYTDRMLNNKDALKRSKEGLTNVRKKKEELGKERESIKKKTNALLFDNTEIVRFGMEVLNQTLPIITHNITNFQDGENVRKENVKRMEAQLSADFDRKSEEVRKGFFDRLSLQIKKDFDNVTESVRKLLTKYEQYWDGFDELSLENVEGWKKLEKDFEDWSMHDAVQQSFKGINWRTKTKEVKRKNRKFFWQIWKDKWVYETITDYQYITQQGLAGILEGKVREKIKELSDSLNNTMSDIYENKKMQCIEMLSRTDEVVQDYISQIERINQSIEENRENIEENSEKINWIIQLNSDLNELTEGGTVA